MLLTNLQTKLSTIRKGSFHKVTYKEENNGYAKETTIFARMGVNYKHTRKYLNRQLVNQINGTITAPRKSPFKATILENTIFVTNNDKTVLRVYPIANHKAHSTYTYNGQTIDRDTYYNGLNKKPRQGSCEMLTIEVANILAID